MDAPSLARALDALIDAQRRAVPTGAPDGDAPPAAANGAAAPAPDATVRDLAALAAALDGLPKPPAPAPAFRAALAARLAAAPAPASLGAAPAAPAGAAPAPLSTTELSRAFDASLEALAAGESAGRVQARLGPAAADADLADLLALAATLYELPDAPAPRPAFRSRLRDALDAAPPPSSLRRRSGAPLLARLGRRLWQSTKVMAGAAAAVIVFAGAGVTYAAASALPGDWLYPVKRTTERAQLWLAGPTEAMGHHLAFADRRLDEAVAVPPLAGLTLAEFNREVTAALAAADAALALRIPREHVADPLLRWLLAARGDLVAHQGVLPVMPWRGARALVDEAILALDGGRPLAERLIPRLGDPAAVLALRAPAGQPWTSIARGAALAPQPPIVADVPLGAPAAPIPGRAARPLAAGVPVAAAAALALAPAPRDGAAGGGAAGGGTVDPGPGSGDPGPGVPGPRPTRRPADPTPTSARATATAGPGAEPTRVDPAPSATAETPPSVLPTTPAPTAEPATPTSVTPPTAPPPTATPAPAMPADPALTCTATTVEVYQTTDCTLDLAGWALPDGWDIAWSTSSPNPAHDPELVQSDPRAPRASFTPKTALSGVSKLLVALEATVRDGAGEARATGRIILFVVPRNHGAAATPAVAP